MEKPRPVKRSQFTVTSESREPLSAGGPLANAAEWRGADSAGLWPRTAGLLHLRHERPGARNVSANLTLEVAVRVPLFTCRESSPPVRVFFKPCGGVFDELDVNLLREN